MFYIQAFSLAVVLARLNFRVKLARALVLKSTNACVQFSITKSKEMSWSANLAHKLLVLPLAV